MLSWLKNCFNKLSEMIGGGGGGGGGYLPLAYPGIRHCLFPKFPNSFTKKCRSHATVCVYILSNSRLLGEIRKLCFVCCI
jgi:hypothetical protein